VGAGTERFLYCSTAVGTILASVVGRYGNSYCATYLPKILYPNPLSGLTTRSFEKVRRTIYISNYPNLVSFNSRKKPPILSGATGKSRKGEVSKKPLVNSSLNFA